MLGPKAIAFDAYGTLLDVSSLGAQLRHLDPEIRKGFVMIWRSKQLEYTRLRTVMKRYTDFESVSGDALRYAMKATGIDAKRFDGLMEELRKIRCFPEVPAALGSLKSQLPRMVILSNGTRPMLISALEVNRIQDYFEEVLSVDAVKAYKPDPAVYALATEHFDLQPGEILFVSSNSWDISGAASFGLMTAWCNRTKTVFDELGFTPEIEVRDMKELADKLEAGI